VRAPTGGYTRVTLVGSGDRVDVVLPSDEPVGRLMPEILALTREPAGTPARLRHLATLDGTLLPEDSSMGQAGVADGTLIRVVGLENAPPPMVVHDVTEVVADDLDVRAWRWGDVPRRWTATVLVAAASLFATVLLGSDVDVQIPAVAAAVLLIGGALVARFLHPALGTATVLAGAAVGVAAATTSGLGVAGQGALVVAILSVTCLALGLSTPLGPGGVIGGVAGLAVLGAWGVAAALALPPDRAAALLAVASVAAVGLLPRVALATSGLTALDDRRAREEPVGRPAVASALDAAHRGLTLATVAVAGSAALAGWLLARHPSRWTVPLALVLVLVLAVRARAFPLLGEVLALVVAVAIVSAALLLAWARSAGPWSAGAVLVGVAVLCGAALVAAPPDHVRARARLAADRLEALGVIAMVPVAVGVFGLYGALLRSA
jgi:type VII secretion integral membrane protein EccD